VLGRALRWLVVKVLGNLHQLPVALEPPELLDALCGHVDELAAPLQVSRGRDVDVGMITAQLKELPDDLKVSLGSLLAIAIPEIAYQLAKLLN